MTQTKGSNIFIGDILRLKDGDIAPCDLLVLATSTLLNGQQICRVDSMFDDGRCNRQLKEAVSLTQSFNQFTQSEEIDEVKKFLQRLYARVEYHRIQETHQITGTFKLKADPRVENFDERMIVNKGSILRSRYIYGLVLYNGMKCLDTNTSSAVYLTKASELDNKVRAFSFCLIALGFILTILSTLTFNRIRSNGGSIINTFFAPNSFVCFMSLYFCILPMTACIFLNSFYVISSIILQNKYRGFDNSSDFKAATSINGSVRTENNKPRSLDVSSTLNKKIVKNSFRILNPNVIPDLGDIDDAFFDKTGTISSNTYDVQTIATTNKLYICDSSNFGAPNSVDIHKTYVNEPHQNEQRKEEKANTKTNFNSNLENIDPEADSDFDEMSKNNERGIKSTVPTWDFRTKRMEHTPFENEFNPEAVKIKTNPVILATPATQKSPLKDLLKKASKSIKKDNIKKLTTPSNQEQRFKFNTDKIFNQEDFASDFKYTSEVKDLIMMFAYCHKARPSNGG